MTTVTMDRLRSRTGGYWHVTHMRRALTPVHRRWMARWGLPVEGNIADSQSVYRAITIEETPGANAEHTTHWRGFTGPGVLFINAVRRRRRTPLHPHIAEFCKAVYEQDYPLTSLRYVFVTNVANTDTTAFIERYIPRLNEEPEETGAWDTSSEVTTYDSSSPEYLGLLGTRIGKMVGYFIIAAYGQGVKRISEISIWLSNGHWQLLFVLENVPVDQGDDEQKSKPDFMKQVRTLRKKPEQLAKESKERAQQKQQASC
jgi:hypothetical protein